MPLPRPRRAAARAAAALLCGAALLLGLPSPVSAASSTAPAPAAAVPGMFDHPGAKQGSFISLDAHNGLDELQAQRDFEARWQRRADLVRVFAEWEQPALFTPAEKTLAAEGRRLVVSWNSWGKGTGVPWADVASGKWDGLIDRRAQEVKELGRPIMFTFQHEPEHWTTNPETRAGTPAQFCDAYRHVVDRFRAADVPNASYGEIMMAWSANQGRAEPYYCGDAHVEWLASDGYNWYGCVNPQGPWRSPAEVFGAWYTWARSHGKPLVIAEWGTGEDPAVPGRKAQWIDALNTYVKSKPEIKGVMIYSTAKNKNCPRYSDTSPSSQEAFVRFGADPYYDGQAGGPGTAPSAPRIGTATPGAPGGPVTASVTWSPPKTVGSSPVTAYRITAAQVDANGVVKRRTQVERPASDRSVELILPAAAQHHFVVAAINGAGAGPGSVRSNTVAGQ